MPLVKKYPSRVREIQRPLEDIYVVTLASLGRSYAYLPGQFLHLALDAYDPSLAWPESRCFSMQTAQTDGVIRLTFAVKGVFTKRMAQELVPGKDFVVKLPYGELFSKGHGKEKCVFIAGGTGVTPFLSLFADPSFATYVVPVLYLGVRATRFHIYAGELERAVRDNPGFSVRIVDQEREGILDIAGIHAVHGSAATYFVSGPPVMIKTFKQYLLSAGVPPERVRTDDWE